VWRFVPRDGGSPNRIEIHSEVPIIKGIFDDSGSFDYTVKNRFSDPTKEQ